MRLRNGEHGYGAVTKLLHWVTVLAIIGQFVLGWTMDADAPTSGADARVDAFEEQGEERAEQQGEAAEERFEAEVEGREDAADSAPSLGDVLTGAAFGDGVDGVEIHVLVGLLVLLLGLVRLWWRRSTPLPPWAEHLGPSERKLESALEKAMLMLLLVVPVSGLLLILVSDDLLPLHVVAQIALLATVAGHVALVLKHTLVREHRHLARML